LGKYFALRVGGGFGFSLVVWWFSRSLVLVLAGWLFALLGLMVFGLCAGVFGDTSAHLDSL